jgi:hypothetical protein
MKYIILFLLAFPVFAADYVIARRDGVTTITGPYGSWTGYISTLPGKLAGNRHVLEFDFTSPDYFSDQNSGHFAIGIHGNGYTIEGRGVVIGNVKGYPYRDDGCRPATTTNAVAFESYWLGGNCVFGWSESEPLENFREYHLKITSGKDKVVTYDLSKYALGRRYLISSQRTYDYSDNFSALDNGGWFIAEVFSSHDWTMYINNLTERVE